VIKKYNKKKKDHEEDFDMKKDVFFILLSLFLFVFGILYRKRLHNTPYAVGEYFIFLSSYFLSGWRILLNAGKNSIHGRIFDENFLMSTATLGAIIIHELPEAVGVMLFFRIGEFFQNLSVSRSRRSIRSLLEIRPDYANLRVEEGIKKVSPTKVRIGDTIIIKPGEKIPLDGEVIEGSSQVDTSALTGESIPVMVKKKDTVLAGMINQTGVLTVKVTKLFSQSSVSKILHLVEKASSKKAETEKFITRFAKYYTPTMVLGALGVALIPPLVIPGAGFYEWIYRALILLVISCPCALVISIPLGYFGGIGGASRKGILVKGSNFLDVFTKVKTVVFDKTGTLTKGVFKVTHIVPKNGFSKERLLRIGAEVESRSNHPVAISIVKAYGKRIDSSIIKNYREIPGYGVKAKIRGHEVIAGNDRMLHKNRIKHDVCKVDKTVVHIVVDETYAGYIEVSDELKDDAKKAVEDLKSLGVKKVIMLTGDDRTVAENVAKKLNLDSYEAELLPEEKVAFIEELIRKAKKGEKVAFVGDGINDAPVIARADVGVAMGGVRL